MLLSLPAGGLRKMSQMDFNSLTVFSVACSTGPDVLAGGLALVPPSRSRAVARRQLQVPWASEQV